jgi:hypothetical protein
MKCEGDREGLGRRQSWPIWKYYSGILLAGLMETKKDFGHDSR